MMELTESAVSAIRTAISGSPEAVEGLRIMVESGGCAGNKYMMGLVTDSQPGDVVVEKGGVKVFIDANSVAMLEGAVMDFTISMEGSGFTFSNPNATSSCACGKSFG